MARLAALWIRDDISIEILPIPRWTFTCFSKNGHKSTQTRCKVCSNLTSALQQLTFVLLVCFINLEQFHTLLYSFPHFEKVNVGWQCALNVLSKRFVMLTYTDSHAPEIFLWRCSCHRNEKQNSNSFFNYDSNLTSVITTELNFFSLRCSFLCMTSLSVTPSVLKTSVKFWVTSFKFWLRHCDIRFTTWWNRAPF